MSRFRWPALLTALLIAVTSAPVAVDAQVGTRLKEAAKRRAEQEAARKAAEAAKKAEEDARKGSGAAGSADSSKATKGDSAAVARPGTPAAASAPTPTAAKVWENYDFVPGNKVIFFTDFSEDKVGNFARGLKYSSGPIEIVERDGVKVLRSTGRSEILIPVGKQLPERFTLEIDVIAPRAACCGYEMVAFEGGAVRNRGNESSEIAWTPSGSLIIGSAFANRNMASNIPESMQGQLRGNVAHLRVLMDGPYLKMYTNERRMYNIPEFPFRRDSVIRLFVNGTEEPDVAVYLASIRVAESETDVLYDALAARGRWATHGILFATGKSDLQPESHAVLKEIAATLRKYGDLKILIEGHTDNVGSAASNLTLSDARAAAVKTALVAQYGIDGARVTTQGLGDTKPSVPNTTATGRAQNRRVEIVKQ
ncbi:MAG: OmpA family protein [Gemmatimonadaceae bacterium]|nr:OmpA family protein [Gemmatimonadaceae bacterium]